MAIDIENIKKIVLKTDNATECELFWHYKDALKITQNSISYERFDKFFDEKIESWEYKSTSDDFKLKFEKLLKCLEKEINPTKGMTWTTDMGLFTITIFKSDGSSIEIARTGDFYYNNMDDISNVIKDMIPSGKIYSDMLEKSPPLPEY